MIDILKFIALALFCLAVLVLIVYMVISTFDKARSLKPAESEKKRAGKKKLEFSKLIFAFVSTVYIAVIVYSLVMMAITFDLTPLAYIIPATATELATATGFYYWKARAENKIKLKKEYDMPLSEDDFDGGEH